MATRCVRGPGRRRGDVLGASSACISLSARASLRLSGGRSPPLRPAAPPGRALGRPPRSPRPGSLAPADPYVCEQDLVVQNAAALLVLFAALLPARAHRDGARKHRAGADRRPHPELGLPGEASGQSRASLPTAPPDETRRGPARSRSAFLLPPGALASVGRPGWRAGPRARRLDGLSFLSPICSQRSPTPNVLPFFGSSSWVRRRGVTCCAT